MTLDTWNETAIGIQRDLIQTLLGYNVQRNILDWTQFQTYCLFIEFGGFMTKL